MSFIVSLNNLGETITQQITENNLSIQSKEKKYRSN